MSDQTTETTVDTTAPATTEQVQLQLQLQDLLSAVQIIQLASSRGAFKPNEMVAVGQTYTKLATFLETIAAQQQAAAPAAPAAGTPTGA